MAIAVRSSRVPDAITGEGQAYGRRMLRGTIRTGGPGARGAGLQAGEPSIGNHCSQSGNEGDTQPFPTQADTRARTDSLESDIRVDDGPVGGARTGEKGQRGEGDGREHGLANCLKVWREPSLPKTCGPSV